MMNDLSFQRFQEDNIEECYQEIKKIAFNSINFIWLGIQDYEPILKIQKRIHKDIVKGDMNDVVLLLEHNHVYTLGKNANKNHVLTAQNKCSKVVQVDRGGDVTYHGPGQLVGYPILDLNRHNKSITWYITLIQESIINLLDFCGVKALKKNSPFIGVWVGDEKVAAIGVRLSRWVSMHGFAININTDLEYYDGIIPCGIFDLGTTSLKELLGKDFDVKNMAKQISNILKHSLKGVPVC